MALLRTISNDERETMTLDAFMETVVEAIQKADGPIAIRTRYQSLDKTKDLWLYVTPVLVPEAESDAIAAGLSVVPTNTTVH